jgi:hypothetical protein
MQADLSLRRWYDRVYAERSERRSRLRIDDGSTIIIGRTYDFEVRNHRGQRVNLYGWQVVGHPSWSDTVIELRKPRLPYGGTSREFAPSNILSAVELYG